MMVKKLSFFIFTFLLCFFIFCPVNFALADNPNNGDTVSAKTPKITELPVLMDLPTADAVVLGQKYTFKGTISSKTKLTKVTLLVEGAGQLATVEPGETSFNLNNITVNTTGDILSKPGTYTVNIWVKSEDYTNPKEPLGQMKLVVTGLTPETEQQTVKLLQPNEQGFFKVGDAIILSAEASGIDYVKFYVENTSTGKFENPIVQTYVTSWSSDDLLEGSYLVRVVGYSKTAQELVDDTAYFTLNAEAPEITELPTADEVVLGQKYTFKGTISSKTKLTKVTLLVEGAGQLATVEPGETSFNLNNITVNTPDDVLSKPGTYTVNVWAKSEDYTNPDKPVGQMQLVVKEPAPKPQFSVTINNNQPIIQGDSVPIEVNNLESPAGVKSIQYFVVKNNIPHEKKPENSTDQTLEWDTGGTAVGSYFFMVVVTDNNGQTNEMQQPVEILAKPAKPTFKLSVNNNQPITQGNAALVKITNLKAPGGVKSIRYFVEGPGGDYEKFPENPNGETLEWQTDGTKPGKYTIRAEIMDKYNRKGIAKQIVTVVSRDESEVKDNPQTQDEKLDAYPLKSVNLDLFGQFDYREDSGGRIKINPTWVSKNIETITLPGINKQVKVHRHAKQAFMDAFNKIAADPDLLKLVNTIDGTFVARHVNWIPSRGLSKHSWGIAIDINVGTHPLGIPAGEDAANRILWEEAFKPAGFVWGGNWSGADVDPMHFQLGN